MEIVRHGIGGTKCMGKNCDTSFYGQQKPHLLQMEAF